ncbi:MAG TPA: P1 family peptidase [Solirubrobacterales bacterium]|nr:P1 family peptidase [Solirubrobacterales bacterium]
MSGPGAELPLPAGFTAGHWTDREAETGCTVVLPPEGSACGVDVRGGGPGSRETEIISPLANAQEATAVLLTGGSAYGLAAADGVARWCEERGRGYATPGGLVPLVPAAVIYDLIAGDASVRPGPAEGYAACEAAASDVPERGRVGAGTGAAVAKAGGREHATPGGVGYAAAKLGTGEVVAALAVVNATGDVVDADGTPLARPRVGGGEGPSSAELIASMPGPPAWASGESRDSTTLVCVVTDAALDKLAANKVARMAAAGVPRAIDPVYTPFDGDITFCLSGGGAGAEGAPSWRVLSVGTLGATVTAAAIRDAIRSANPA